VIVGDGSLKTYLIDLTKKLNIAEDVLFLGFQDNPFKYVARSSLFVFTSLYEGFGNVLAMALGCPIVSYDCIAGPREILAPEKDTTQQVTPQGEAKYGVLIPVGDISSLVNAIVRLLSTSELRSTYSEIGRKRALDFEMNQTVQKYMDVIFQ
jgi:glycosyltransferase involved in cell wall biosynthesis